MRKISKIICLVVLLFSFSNSFCMQAKPDDFVLPSDELGTVISAWEYQPLKEQIFYYLKYLFLTGKITIEELFKFIARTCPCDKFNFDEYEKILSRVGK